MELPDDIVAESVPFRLLQSHVQSMTGDYETKRVELDKAVKEADALREHQDAFRQMVFVRPPLGRSLGCTRMGTER